MDDNHLDPSSEDDFEESVQNVNIEQQMETAYIDYAMSVIVGRALPDVRDGLKPVHRRVLYAMHELSMGFSKAHKKSARVVGEVLGKYHPHGDSSVYGTMVRMAQPWSMRYMMIDGQGNFGSQDGDGPAAMRYTETRMQRLSESMMDDIEKDTVDFIPNFDETLEEPTVLPTRIPQLLVNGSSGIAVGMATNMMPHNLSEVIDGCVAYVNNRDITIEELMEHVKAPDFPTGGIIYGIEGVRRGLMTGRGRVVVRGVVEIELSANGREKIIIKEVPYQVSRDALTEKIGHLVNNKIITGITNVANESNKEGTRIVIDVRRDAVAQVIVNHLYKHTELETSFGINNVALVNGRPRTLNLKDLIKEFIKFRHEIVVRRTQFELNQAEARAHILEGYLKVISSADALDRAIKIIRESTTPDTARTGLMEAFELSEIQARAILELRLRTLTGLEIDKIQEEYDSLMEKIAYLKEILGNEDKRYEIIEEELLEVKEKYGDERRSKIQYAANEMRIEDLIEEEDVVITMSHLGYIKRTSADEFRAQRRGGRGSRGSRTREADFIQHLFIASTHHTLLFFTEKGRCFWLRVYEIPETERNGQGRAIQNLIQIPSDDRVKAIIDVPRLDDKEYTEAKNIILCTKKGTIKKTELEAFSRPRQNGINAITINEGDELLEAAMTDGDNLIMMAVRSGRAITFEEEKVRPTGRGAIGVRGITLDTDNDEVVGMICLSKKEADKQILVVSEKGLGKRTNFLNLVENTDELSDEDKEKLIQIDNEEGETSYYELSYRITNRGGKGVKTLNVTERTGDLIGMLAVLETDDLIITNQSGITIRMNVENIRLAGRATQGVKLINIDDGDQIAAIARIDTIEDDEEEVEGEENQEENGTTPTASSDETAEKDSDELDTDEDLEDEDDDNDVEEE